LNSDCVGNGVTYFDIILYFDIEDAKVQEGNKVS